MIGTAIREIEDFDRSDVFERSIREGGPVVFRGLGSDWPIVQKSRASARDAADFLKGFYADVPVPAFISKSRIGGRMFYTDDLDNLNFEKTQTKMDWVLDKVLEQEDDPQAPTVYMGSTALDYCLPGFSQDNSLELGDIQATVRIWIGNRTTVAAHYDAMDNIAVVSAGRRRFTLFPPEQLENLYVGPIDFTPAGQSISLVDLHDPDLDRFPKFAEALEHAQSAVLEPGDGVYVPNMWWHHVEGLETFNILINHWWRQCPEFMGAPNDALLHAILNIRELPEAQRRAWQGMFDHYVFNPTDEASSHIPEDSRGVLGELDESMARKIRAQLRDRLNR